MAEKQNIAQMRRLVARNRRQRNWERSAFPTSTAGLVRPPSPFLIGGTGNGQGGEISLGVPPIGELIRCAIAGDIGSGGANVLFNSAQIQLGFEGQFLPSPQLLLPHTAIYGIEGELVYESPFKSGGVVSLRINDVEFLEIGGFNESWTRFAIAEEFYANAGDWLSIKVTHNDTTADGEVGGFLTCATKEPLALVLPEPAEFVDFVDANSGSGSGTIDVSPLGVESGDLLLAFGSQNGDGSSDTLLDGFTLAHRVLGGGGPSVAMLSKIATGSEGVLNWSWPGSAGGATMWVCRITNGAVAQTATANPAAGTNHTTPDCGAILAGQLAFFMIGKSGGVSITTAPSPATKITAASEPNGNLYRDDTAGTSVRSFVFNGSSNAPMISARVGAA